MAGYLLKNTRGYPLAMKKTPAQTLYQFFVVCSFPLVLLSCSSKPGEKNVLDTMFSSDFVDMASFKSSISAFNRPVNTADSLFQKNLLQDIDLNVDYVYQLSGNEPIWFTASGLKKGTEDMTRQLNDLWDEGLNPGTYRIGYLQEMLSRLKNKKETFPVDSIVQWDRALTRAYLNAARDLLLGTREIRKADSLWFARNDTTFDGANYLAATRKQELGFPALDTFRPSVPQYLQMKKAVGQWTALKKDSAYLSLKKQIVLGQQDSVLQQLLQKELSGTTVSENDSLKGITSWIATYQYYHQLKITGKNDSATYKSLTRSPEDYIRHLHMNMDRLRALPRIAGAEHVWVNIPLMEVSYYRDDQVKFHGRVVVGKKSRQTPSLWAPMANVVFNPPWGVPPTILRNDVGPGVTRAGSGYLARKGLRAFDANGKDVTGSVNGANYRRFSYRQPPGAHNSLGEVKFNLPNKWDIYLHDTPHRENFTNRYRALSSGCVRVQNPKLLAEAILEDRKFTAEKIDSIIQTRRTKFEQLKRHLPVYIVYITVAPDSTGNQLRYLDDVYGRDARMKKIYAN